jgi:hypothetical protein
MPTSTLVKAAAVYAALHVLLLIALAARVVLARRRAKVGIGDGGDPDLARAIRVHGNAVEQAAPTFALLVFLPLLGAPAWALHACGVATLLGRVLHAAGLSKSAGVTLGRQAGMILTWTALGAAALGVVVLASR